MLGSDNEFSDLKDIDEDDQKGNYIHTNNKVISASIMYQYSYIFSYFLANAYLSSTLHPPTSVATTYHTNQIFIHHLHHLLSHYPLLFCQHLPSKHLNHHYYLPLNH